MLSPDIMQLARQSALHAAARQGVISTNIANADTPGYRAKVLPDFGSVMQGFEQLRTTRAGHLESQGMLVTQARPERAPDTQKPNGNTVSLEHQMMHAARARLDHDTALAVYASARNILRASLGR